MGVKGIWPLLKPVGRKTNLTRLSNKVLAIDASIWLYQFVKVIPKNGQMSKNFHIVGFFRRICKLLFFNIKPIFIFDGVPPSLKDKTMKLRNSMKVKNNKELNKLAKKLLISQLKEAAINLTTPNRSLSSLGSAKKSSSEKKKLGDEYELPELKEELAAKINPEDPRYDESFDFDKEYKDYLQQYRPELADLNLDQIDHLSLETKYSIISDLRDKSRQTSKQRLEYMKKNSETGYDFSQLQIQNLVKRNDLTQKFLDVAGFTDRHLPTTVGGRVAQEKGKTFTLIKKEGDKLGWKLSNRSSAEKLQRAGQQPSSDVPTPIALSSELHIPSETGNANDLILNSFSNPPSSAFKLSSEDFNNIVFTKIDASSNPTNVSTEPKENSNEARLKELEAWANYLPPNISEQFPNPQNYHQIALNEWDVDKVKLELKGFEDRISANESNLDGLICYTEFLTSLLNFRNQSLLGEDMPSSPPIDDWDSPSMQSSFLDLPPLPATQTSSPNQSMIMNDTNILSSSDVFGAPSNIPSDSTFQSGLFSDAPGPPINDDVEKEQPQRLANKLIRTSPDKQHFQKRGFHLMSPTLAARMSKKDLLDDELNSPKSHTKSKRRKQKSINNEVLQLPSNNNEPNNAIPILQSKIETIKTSSNSPTKSNLISNEEVEEVEEVEIEAEDNSIEEEILSYAKANGSLNNSIELGEDSKLSENLDDSLTKENTTLEDMALEMEEELNAEEFLLNLRNKQLPEVSNELRREIEELSAQAAQQAAKTQEITPAMVEEIYRLLNIMGVPFLLAPGEAEAQCVELINLGLAQGVITDDSDCFLFGNCIIYRNVFSTKTRVECYKSSDFEEYLQLDRNKLIDLAQLLGSDYTEGIHGIGTVLALEILAEFENLSEFKRWWETEVKHSVLAKEGESATKKRLRNASSRVYLPDEFPSREVEEAYLHPLVNSNSQPFEWGDVKFGDLHAFLHDNLGWGRDKLKQILDPVLENKEKLQSQPQSTQTTLGDFFTKEPTISSKRVKQAIEILKFKKEEKGLNIEDFFSDDIDLKGIKNEK